MSVVSQYEDLAARTLAAIDRLTTPIDARWFAADRERVASDLAGLRLTRDAALDEMYPDTASRLMAAFSEGLRRTAALYGVTP